MLAAVAAGGAPADEPRYDIREPEGIAGQVLRGLGLTIERAREAARGDHRP